MTCCPSEILRAVIIPSAGAGISIDALSDSNTIRVSPSATESPTATTTSMTVTPSALPVSGTETNWALPLDGALFIAFVETSESLSAMFSGMDVSSTRFNSQIGSPSLTSEPSDK